MDPVTSPELRKQLAFPRRFDSIRSRILVFAVLATMVPCGVTLGISYVQNRRVLPVPMTLRDKHSSTRRLNQEGSYVYPHNTAEGWVDQDYLGVERTYYEPTERGHEAEIKRRLEHWRALRTGEPTE